MAKEHVYGEVNNESDLKRISGEIRAEVERTKTRPELTEHYRRAGYLVTLTYSPAWEKKFGDAELKRLRQIADDEFASTAAAINKRAKAIGTDPSYDTTWGKG